MSFEEDQRNVRRQLDAEIKAKDAEIDRLKCDLAFLIIEIQAAMNISADVQEFMEKRRRDEMKRCTGEASQ